MTTSDTAGTNPGERIEEVDLKEKKVSSSHEAAEVEWHILDNHQQNFSFSDVHPANITVRNLEVEVEVAAPFADTLKAKFTKPKVADVEGGAADNIRRKKILKDVSADFPAGTLTAIIGGSGSGKVHGTPHSRGPIDANLLPLIDYLPQRSISSYAGIQHHHRRKHTVQRISRPSHNHQRLRHPNRCLTSVPHCPGNPALCCVPATPIIHHFSAAQPTGRRGHSRTRPQGMR